MRNLLKLTGAALALVTIISSAPVAAQQPPPQRQPRPAENAQETMPATGELIALDDQARTLAIKTEAGVEMKFSYSEKTEVVGADKELKSLTKMNGTRLTVTYGAHGTSYTATKIEVMAKN